MCRREEEHEEMAKGFAKGRRNRQRIHEEVLEKDG